MSDRKNLIDISKEKSSVSARVNKHVVDIYKDKEIPISLVIETSLVNFLRLTDKEKMKFLSENIPEKVYVDDLKIPKVKWEDLLRGYLKRMTIPASVMNGLFTGLALGAITIIGGLLNTVESIEDEDSIDDVYKNIFDEE